MSRTRSKPRFLTAEEVAGLIAWDNVRDDDFGSMKEYRKEVRKTARKNGHQLEHWKFRGGMKWKTYCKKCNQFFSVEEDGIKLFPQGACVTHVWTS
jgi:hypothetical protein